MLLIFLRLMTLLVLIVRTITAAKVYVCLIGFQIHHLCLRVSDLSRRRGERGKEKN